MFNGVPMQSFSSQNSATICLLADERILDTFKFACTNDVILRHATTQQLDHTCLIITATMIIIIVPTSSIGTPLKLSQKLKCSIRLLCKCIHH